MSVRPETLALLDRMFGDERSVDDALARIDNAANELCLNLEHLEVVMRKAATDIRDAANDEERIGVMDTLRHEAQWSESNRGREFEAIRAATGEISKLAERWS